MAETLILDPTSEDAANAQLDITGTGYGLIEHHYPQPAIAAQWATSVDTEGSRLGSVKHENRQISITLDVDGLTALRALQAKLGKLHREGGTFKRTLSDATVIVFDVLTVEGYDPEFSYSFDLATVTTVSFTLTCLPYGRAPEVDMGDNVETTLPYLRFTDTGIKGDMPGLGRLVIDDDQAQAQGIVVWGMRSRYYDAASTAALFYQGESCSLLSAASAALVGASGGNAARHTNLGNVADPNFDATGGAWIGLHYIGAATTQTHIGTYRVYARTYAPAANASAVSLRCVWRPYVGAQAIYNDYVTMESSAGVPVEDTFMVLDLGLVSLPKATKGSQGWSGWIQAAGGTGDDINVDWVMLLPVDEGAGEAHHVTIDPVVASGSIEIAHNGVMSLASSTFWRRPDSYEGTYLRVPPAGAEARTAEFIVKMSRGQQFVSAAGIDGDRTAADLGIDDLSARLFVTPRYLVVPSA